MTIKDQLTQQIPSEWFTTPVEVEVDDDEILCVGTLPTGASVDAFRESTRDDRMRIAANAESLYRRKVSWGVRTDGATTLFTTLAVPAMTRLRFRERAVLDTLVDAGVARSRSDALAWCVKLVARHEADWLTELRDALVSVEKVRREGPVEV
jgi:hypothetical protein